MQRNETLRRFAIALLIGAAALGGATAARATARGQDSVGAAATKAADKTGDAAKATGEAAKQAGKTVGDKTVDGAKATGKAGKKVGSEVADKSEDVADATVKGTKKTGNWFVRMWKKVF